MGTLRYRRSIRGVFVQHRQAVPRFDPRAHERELRGLIAAIQAEPDLDARGLDRLLRAYPREGRGFFSKSEIIAGYRAFARPGAALDEARFLERLRLRPVRTLSGVTPVTVLTRPFPCPGTCIFCPSDVRMPKSYLADEPGAQRAENNGFDPYLQTWNRLDAYHSIGHPVDKVELIVLGGTWSHHPESYQRWFVTRCLEAISDFGGGLDGRAEAGRAPSPYAEITPIRGDAPSPRYNQAVRAHLEAHFGPDLLHESEAAAWSSLEAAQRRNESAPSRCVGLVVETRPDSIDDVEVLRLRALGVTKVQLGIQSLDDEVLKRSRRGHGVAESRSAVLRLRAAGFKIHAHWMANLPGATPDSDVADYARLFDDPDFRPDELKLYPCLLVESAELMGAYAREEWRPYTDAELLRVLEACMKRTPRWCRLTRVVRDFSSHDIVAGTRTANLREVAEGRLRDRGEALCEVRNREIRGEVFDRASLEFRETRYATSLGEECFLEFVTPADRLVGFCRLALPHKSARVDELCGRALLREVHVYGASLPLGTSARDSAQHAGLGTRLVEVAAARAKAAGFEGLAVISAVGTRAWYRRLGFRDGALYQHRALSEDGEDRAAQ